MPEILAAALSDPVCSVGAMAIARYPGFVLDCPDAGALAQFYGALLEWEVKADDDWAEIRAPGQCISFQQVANYNPPVWPGQDVPQQMHLDVIVDDLDAAEQAVIDLGASKHEHQPGTSFRVFLDPAGHPFCLCVN
jgi:predicted enzyme related to lactoylglutathione lyase